MYIYVYLLCIYNIYELIYYVIYQLGAISPANPDWTYIPEELQVIHLAPLETAGHRADIRSICITSDGHTMITCSTNDIKCWNRHSYTCIKSIALDYYALCMVLMSGDRYVLVGTKEGHIQVRM